MALVDEITRSYNRRQHNLKTLVDLSPHNSLQYSLQRSFNFMSIWRTKVSFKSRGYPSQASISTVKSTFTCICRSLQKMVIFSKRFIRCLYNKASIFGEIKFICSNSNVIPFLFFHKNNFYMWHTIFKKINIFLYHETVNF